jgi:hypothetical protein
MNGLVEFDYGMYSVEAEYCATVNYDEGTYDTPSYLEWDLQEDDVVIKRTDENGESEYIDANHCDLEFLEVMWRYIEEDIRKVFE